MTKKTNVTTVGERELVVTRLFDAPRELVFRAHTDPEHLKHWWAPRPYTLPTCNIDLRPGGVWHYAMRSPEGEEHWGRGIYEEIAPPERLVFRDAFADADGNATSPETIVTVTFEDQGGQTLVTMRSLFADGEQRDAAIEMGVEQGISMALDQLEQLLVAFSGSDRELILTRTFDAPRDLVFEAWTNPEHLPQWMCPRDFSISSREADVREGGDWRYVMHGPDGTDYENRIRFLEIAPLERIVYDHDEGRDDDPNAFRVTVLFREAPGGTEVTMRMMLPTAARREEALGFGALELGYSTLEKLGELLERELARA